MADYMGTDADFHELLAKAINNRDFDLIENIREQVEDWCELDEEKAAKRVLIEAAEGLLAAYEELGGDD